jgi:hypothetical protein
MEQEERAAARKAMEEEQYGEGSGKAEKKKWAKAPKPNPHSSKAMKQLRNNKRER